MDNKGLGPTADVTTVTGDDGSPARLSSAEPQDDFRGDNARLRDCIRALLDLDADGALVPHGVGGHARALLSAAYCRLPS